MSQLDFREQNLDDWVRIYQMISGRVIYNKRRIRTPEPKATKTKYNIADKIPIYRSNKSISQ